MVPNFGQDKYTIMAKHLMQGRAAEQIAALYFTKKFYLLRHRNYRYRKSEIDLIVEKGGLLLFVEVKSAKHSRFGEPEKNIKRGQVNRIKLAAEAYQHATLWEGEIRFDSILLTFFPQAIKIEHFKDAFS